MFNNLVNILDNKNNNKLFRYKTNITIDSSKNFEIKISFYIKNINDEYYNIGLCLTDLIDFNCDNIIEDNILMVNFNKMNNLNITSNLNNTKNNYIDTINLDENWYTWTISYNSTDNIITIKIIDIYEKIIYNKLNNNIYMYICNTSTDPFNEIKCIDII
jgi:hypothetical protein